jgi:hypothetical protein
MDPKFKLDPPQGADLPSAGFIKRRSNVGFPVKSGADDTVEINISKESDRIRYLKLSLDGT